MSSSSLWLNIYPLEQMVLCHNLSVDHAEKQDLLTLILLSYRANIQTME